MSENKDFSQRVRIYREREGISQEELAKRLGMSRNYVSMIEGGRAPSDQVVRHFELLESSKLPGGAENHNASGNPLVQEKSSTYRAGPNQLRGVPLITWEDATEAITLIDFADAERWEHFVPSDIQDSQAIAVTIRGDSMEPDYKDGNIAVLACSAQPQSGSLIIGRLKEEGVVFKMFQILSVDPPRYRLSSFNDRYASIERVPEDFLWIYPVHSVIKKLM